MNEDIKKNKEVLDEENLENASGGVLRIPMENVEEICDDDLENVAGGMRPGVCIDPFK